MESRTYAWSYLNYNNLGLIFLVVSSCDGRRVAVVRSFNETSRNTEILYTSIRVNRVVIEGNCGSGEREGRERVRRRGGGGEDLERSEFDRIAGTSGVRSATSGGHKCIYVYIHIEKPIVRPQDRISVVEPRTRQSSTGGESIHELCSFVYTCIHVA